jgi:two-component system sensor kinase FixL
LVFLGLGVAISTFGLMNLSDARARKEAENWHVHTLLVLLDAEQLRSRVLALLPPSSKAGRSTGGMMSVPAAGDAVTISRLIEKMRRETSDNDVQRHNLAALSTRFRRLTSQQASYSDLKRQVQAIGTSIDQIALEEQRLLTSRADASERAGRKALLYSWLLAFFGIGLIACSAIYALILRQIGHKARAEHRIVEEQLSNTSSVLRAIISGIPGLIYAKDLEGRYTLANPAATRLMGVSWAGMKGRTDAEILPDAMQGRAIMDADRRIMNGGVAETIEEAIGTLKGAPRIWLSTKAPLRNVADEVIGMVGMAVEVTDQKAAATKLDILRYELAHMGRLNAMGELSLALAHELNQPLAAIINHIAIVEHAITQDERIDDAVVARRLADATDQAMRAGEIVKRLRAFVENRDCEKRSENVAELVTEATALISGTVARRGMTMSVSAADKEARIMADRIQIQQVVINLIRNAADAMENLAVSRREISVTVESTADRKVRIVIEDDGPGMGVKERLDLFQRFSTDRYRESGLGIPISLRILESHGGELSYDTGAAGGARLTATLPLC